MKLSNQNFIRILINEITLAISLAIFVTFGDVTNFIEQKLLIAFED